MTMCARPLVNSIVRRGQVHEDRRPTRTRIDRATLMAYVITY